MSKARRTAWLGVLLCSAPGLALLDGCATCLDSTPAQGEKVAIKVSLHSWHDVFVELDNVTGNPVGLRAAALPWEWRYSMWVKAFEDDATGSPLAERLTVADLPTTNEKVSLLPGKPLQGNIDLRNRFPELEDVLKRRDVIVFWSYIPEFSNGNNESRLSGWLTIPKFR
jgi:hypothetical protein